MILLTNLSLFGSEKGKKDAAIFLYHLVQRDKTQAIIDLMNSEMTDENNYSELLKQLVKSKYYTTKALAYPNDIDKIFSLKSLDLSIGLSVYNMIEPGGNFCLNFVAQDFKLDRTFTESILCYKFRTVDYDIKFGIYKINSLQFNTLDDILKENDEKKFKSIIRLQKVPSQNLEIKGSIVIKEPGLYKIVFDNSYSYFRSKELFYHVHMLSRYPEALV